MKFKRNPEIDEIDAMQIVAPFTMEQNGCKFNVKTGDWIAQDGLGNIKIYSNDVFKVAYNQVENKE